LGWGKEKGLFPTTFKVLTLEHIAGKSRMEDYATDPFARARARFDVRPRS
jgi:hypothetical protein